MSGTSPTRQSRRRLQVPEENDLDPVDLELDLEDDNDPFKNIHFIRTPKGKRTHMSTNETTRQMNVLQQMSRRMSRYHHGLASSPIILFIIGAACLFFGTCATLVDIRTTENLALGVPGTSVGVMWGVILQPYQLAVGTMTANMQLAAIYAWGVELIQLIFALALVVAVNKLHSVSPTIAKWFSVVGALLILLNAYANFMSAPTANPLIQILMAVLVGGLAVVGLPLGIGFLEAGFAEM